MQGYEEVQARHNPNSVPFLFMFIYFNAKVYYIIYIFHDLIWSLLFLLIGVLLRIEAINIGSYMTIFGSNYPLFVYIFISFGGVFLLLVVAFAAYVNEIPFSLAKKLYIVWRLVISILHLFLCMFIVIFFGIFDSTIKNTLLQNGVSTSVTDDLESYFNIGISVSSFFVVYSILNVFNTFVLMKACKKIHGEMDNEEKVTITQHWGGKGKVVPE